MIRKMAFIVQKKLLHLILMDVLQIRLFIGNVLRNNSVYIWNYAYRITSSESVIAHVHVSGIGIHSTCCILFSPS